ncbi:ubiquitin family protein [Histoplasma capsulatum H143]|uniref:Ubiquitin family protein n=1 Tax=Ajellomyces capsulatus (strain H143) TaxID=544712 RepID=C6HNK2_AJECH|nr:ubiquitin family protein [Histoplasma capsulatum H143]
MSTDIQSQDISGVAEFGNAAGTPAQTVDLHILSPSLEVPTRVTLDNLPLAMKILDLKTRLSETLPSRPRPDIQRLIYRGKPLLNNEERLSNIVQHADGRVHTIHLVLPPSQVKVTIPPPTNDISNLPNPPQESSNLRLRTNNVEPTVQRPHGQAQFNPAAFTSQVAAIRQHVIAQHQHLAAQITQNSRLVDPTRPSGTGVAPAINTTGVPFQNTVENSPLYVDVNSPLYGTRFGLPAPNLQSERVGSTPSTLSHQSPSPWTTMSENPTPRISPVQHTATIPPPSRPTWFGESGTGVGGANENRQRTIATILEQIFAMEGQLRRGHLPVVEEISSIRIQLHQILDEQDRIPLGRRDSMPANLLARLSSLSTRVDQIRISRARSFAFSPQNSLLNSSPTVQDPTQTSLYLLSSPSGYHAILLPPASASGYGTIHTGTIVLISLSAVTALVSETDIPQRFQRAALDPLHRLLEYLLPMDIHQPRDANRASGGVNTNDPAVHPMQPNTINGDLRSTVERQHPTAMAHSEPAVYNRLRTAERALALLVASLVPGVGERRVAARNAAETARQNQLAAVREAEESRAREQENDVAEVPDNAAGEQPGDAVVIEPGTPADPTVDLEEGDSAIET